MTFKQEITWKTVAKILFLFLFVSFFVVLTLCSEIDRGTGFISCVLMAVVYLAVSLAAIAARLGDIDNDLSIPYGDHLRDYKYPRDGIYRYYDPD